MNTCTRVGYGQIRTSCNEVRRIEVPEDFQPIYENEETCPKQRPVRHIWLQERRDSEYVMIDTEVVTPPGMAMCKRIFSCHNGQDLVLSQLGLWGAFGSVHRNQGSEAKHTEEGKCQVDCPPTDEDTNSSQVQEPSVRL